MAFLISAISESQNLLLTLGPSKCCVNLKMYFNVINDIKCAVKIISTEFLFTSVFFPNMPSVMNIRFHFVTRCHELEDSSRTLTLVTK